MLSLQTLAKKRRTAMNGFTDPFGSNVANERRKQLRRVKLGQIAERNEILYDLNVAFHFQLTAADKRRKLLTVT